MPIIVACDIGLLFRLFLSSGYVGHVFMGITAVRSLDQ
jgi:hypothetical protein